MGPEFVSEVSHSWSINWVKYGFVMVVRCLSKVTLVITLVRWVVTI